jgi:hypothetical protein
MSIGFVDLQLWLKNRAAVQISVLLNWVRIVVSSSNVVLVDCLGVRALIEEEQLTLGCVGLVSTSLPEKSFARVVKVI